MPCTAADRIIPTPKTKQTTEQPKRQRPSRSRAANGTPLMGCQMATPSAPTRRRSGPAAKRSHKATRNGEFSPLASTSESLLSDGQSQRPAPARRRVENANLLPAVATPSSEATPSSPLLTQAEALQELARRANAGSDSAVARLGQLLDMEPGIWDRVGDVAALAERAWTDLLSAGDKLLELSIQRRLLATKEGLLGREPTPLERLLVDVIVTTWLAAMQSEMTAAQVGGTPQLSISRARRAESAQRRFACAVRTLSMVRALLPRAVRSQAESQEDANGQTSARRGKQKDRKRQ